MITTITGDYSGNIIYSADSQSYTAKPTGAEIGSIRNRLSGENSHRETPLQQLAQLIESGVTIQGAQLRSKQNSSENTDVRFLRQQLFAVDIDNVCKDKTTGQKVKLPDALETPQQILEISKGAGLTPCIIAESFSSTPQLRKLHVLFAADKPVTDVLQARRIIANLQGIFGAADEACKDPARILFGTTKDKSVYVYNAVNTVEALTGNAVGADPCVCPIDERRVGEDPCVLPKIGTDSNDDPLRLLQMIDPNALSYEEWCRVTASYKLYEGADRSSWAAWNDQYSRVKPKADLRSYDGLTGKGISKGTLKYFAKQHSPAEYESYIRDLRGTSKITPVSESRLPDSQRVSELASESVARGQADTACGRPQGCAPTIGRTHGSSPTGEWGEIKPFEHEPEYQSFPMNALPPLLRDYLKAVADFTAVYPEMGALPLLSVLSLCCQGKAVVKHPGNGHTEQLCLYTLTVAEPGERKTSVFNELMRPLRDYEKRYNEVHRAEIDDYNTHRAFLVSRINNETKSKNGSLDKAKEYKRELRELEEVQSMKLTLTDTTPEALARELHNHGEAIGIMGDEGTILNILGGVYSKSGVNYDIILSCYDGTYYTLSRQTSDDITLYCPLLTMGLMVQQKPFRDTMQSTGLSGKGFLQRFLFSFPRSMAGHIPFETPDVPKTLQDSYAELVTRLLRMPRLDSPPVLTVDREAYSLFNDYHNMTQKKTHPNGMFESAKDYAGKQVAKALRIAALLHLCEHDVNEQINGQTAMNAVQIGLWAENQALKALDVDMMSDTEKNAIYICRRLKRDGRAVYKKRELLRLCSRLTTEEVTAALEVLDERSIVRYTEEKQSRGRPIMTIAVNPAIKDMKI